MNKKTGQFVADMASIHNGLERARLQCQEIGFSGRNDPATGRKGNNLDVTMTPYISRKDYSGSPLSPMYFVERVFQALKEGMYPDPTTAFKGIIVQAEKTGLSDKQRRKILSLLSAVGLHVEGEEQELNDAYRFASKKVEAVQAQSSPHNVIPAVVAAFKSKLTLAHKVENLGKQLQVWKRQAAVAEKYQKRMANDTLMRDVSTYVASKLSDPHDIEEALVVAAGRISGSSSVDELICSPTIRRVATAASRLARQDARQLRTAGWSVEEVVIHTAQKAPEEGVHYCKECGDVRCTKCDCCANRKCAVRECSCKGGPTYPGPDGGTKPESNPWKKGGQSVTTPPKPNTDPGADKKWVYDDSQKSWVAVPKNNNPGMTAFGQTKNRLLLPAGELDDIEAADRQIKFKKQLRHKLQPPRSIEEDAEESGEEEIENEGPEEVSRIVENSPSLKKNIDSFMETEVDAQEPTITREDLRRINKFFSDEGHKMPDEALKEYLREKEVMQGGEFYLGDREGQANLMRRLEALHENGRCTQGIRDAVARKVSAAVITTPQELNIEIAKMKVI